MDEWIDSRTRMPQEGESVSLPGIRGKYLVRGVSLFNNKGQLSIPLSLVEKYKIGL